MPLTQPQQSSSISPLAPPAPGPGARMNWQRLYGAGQGLALAQLARERPLIVLTADARAAQRLEAQIRFFLSGADVPVLYFPDWECLPYDNFSPHQDIISQRLLVLYHLPELKRGVVVAPIANTLQRLPPVEYVKGNSFVLSAGQRVDIDTLRTQLSNVGYQNVGQVLSPGEFSVRGNVIDIFAMGGERPFRLDLFDDLIESIRFFDPESQRSDAKTGSIQLLPAKEFPLNDDGITRFRRAYRSEIAGDPQKSEIYRDVSNGLAPQGIEFYLPLFFDHTASFFDYLPDSITFFLDENAPDAVEKVSADIDKRYESLRHDIARPVLAPERLYLRPEQWDAQLAARRRILIQSLGDAAGDAVAFNTRSVPEFLVNAHSDEPYAQFLDFLNGFKGRVLLIAETAGRREILTGILREHHVPFDTVADWNAFADGDARLAVTVAGEMEQGLHLSEPALAVLTETQLYGERVFQRRRRSRASRDPDAIIRSLAELQVNDPVVHEDHGVGRYRGLSILQIDGNPNEFLTLEYHGGDKLYIPVLSLGVISRYVGAGAETAPLHKLGSEQWIRAKAKARQRAYDIATELLEVQALRDSHAGHAFPRPDDSYDAFRAAFPFEETADQDQVISEVLGDLNSDKPMDRLVCGDVGFGKTEIALRAAFLVTSSGKQVAMIVPTTLLAQQHYQTFSDRFADFPVKIELLSRFRTQKQINQAVAHIASGNIDIVIGTHRLLQKDIRFKDLGLLIIDEEHRFGVRQKERLKQLRSQVDILTMTATPIPRTLNAALSGLREISIIGTPPRARLSIKTFVREWNEAMIREACVREIRRGGQVYFLHNEVKTIEKYLDTLQTLVPEASIRVAHGQMSERELEAVMRDFYHQRFNVLLCTTIIESGIDVPSANTIIINRADRFGLAQLHQLRGRVGRSHHQAFAYLITPPRKILTGDAVKRLQAIESLEDLGAGFALASHDLEIRGAGELLGEAQSGLIDEIGFTMYTEYLNRAIADLQKHAGRVAPAAPAHRPEDIEINLHVAALLPEDYLPDVHLRLVLYKRIANAATFDQLQDLQAEIIDRFGLLPEPGRNLMQTAGLRIEVANIGIKRIDIGAGGGSVEFIDDPDLDPARLIELITSDPARFKMRGTHTLLVKDELPDIDSRIALVRESMARLRSTP